MKHLLFMSVFLVYGNSVVYCQNVQKSTAISSYFYTDEPFWKRLQGGDLPAEKKYAYVVIWSEADAVYMREVIDSIAEKCQNRLLVTGLLDEANMRRLKKIIRKRHIKTPQALLTKALKHELQLSTYPYGILFSKGGKLIKAGIGKNELNTYLEKYGITERAKF